MINQFFYSLFIIIVMLASCNSSEPEFKISNPGAGLELIADGFTAPVVLTSTSDGSGNIYVADQDGQIWILDAGSNINDHPFLDISDRMVNLSPTYDERGLLGLAFHPDFAGNGRFFVYYSAPLRPEGPEDWNHTGRLSEFHVSDTDLTTADTSSERILLEVDQPQSNHNGGQLAFGPSGYLYLALGDGGSANDTGNGHPPQGNGQDILTLLGSILRLDVDGREPYEIPPDNPFVGKDGRDEIWAFGLRNPFRFSFDLNGDGDLYVGDVGQNLYEEVNIVVKGGNYGWNIREGRHCFDPAQPDSPPAECDDFGQDGEPLRAPIIEYDHDTGISVIGGFVYRGSQIPGLVGHYIFGDWSTSFVNANGKILDAKPPVSPGEKWTLSEVEIKTNDYGTLDAYLLSFGRDAQDELYVLTTEQPGPTGSTGKVYKLVSSK